MLGLHTLNIKSASHPVVSFSAAPTCLLALPYNWWHCVMDLLTVPSTAAVCKVWSTHLWDSCKGLQGQNCFVIIVRCYFPFHFHSLLFVQWSFPEVMRHVMSLLWRLIECVHVCYFKSLTVLIYNVVNIDRYKQKFFEYCSTFWDTITFENCCPTVLGHWHRLI